MNNVQFDLDEISGRELELQSLMNVCGKDELAQSVRLLSMHVALYKKSFGDLPQTSFSKILTSDQVDADMARIFENGIREAISILTMVLQSQTVNQKLTRQMLN